MQLSVLVPTHRSGLLAFSRIAQICACACAEVEVIIRDNSGDAAKRSQLQKFEGPHAKIILVDPCPADVNFAETLKQAGGDFVFFVADDDFVFDHAIRALPAKIDAVIRDKSVVAITGRYVLESAKSSTPIAYVNTDSADVIARITGYLNNSPPNLLFYSAVRKNLVKKVFDFFSSSPFSFSFHDQLTCLLYLLNGRYVDMNRLFYLYNLSEWATPELGQKRDLSFYASSNMDAGMNQLHWFLCGFEGASLVFRSDLFPQLPLTQRQFVANIWFARMQVLMKADVRMSFGSTLSRNGSAVAKKWMSFRGNLPLDDMLADICSFIALFSPENAQRYLDFWRTPRS